MLATLAVLTSSAAWLANPAQAQEAAARHGVIEFRPLGDEQATPTRFRLPAHTFPFEQRPIETSSRKIALAEVTFPSPVETPHEVNNTVHCEYFRPAAPGRYPAVVVLHILGGDFDLCRLFGRTFAHQGMCALFVKMPYYGPRRPAEAPQRMISRDPRETVAGMTQAVLDIRRAAAWLASQEEVDADAIGIFGISLGGVTGALAATAEQRFQRVALLLAGGNIAAAATLDAPEREVREALQAWQSSGRSRDELIELFREVDPAQYGESVRGRQILLLNARYDRVIPPVCTEALWESFGRPPIVWYDAGHYSAGRFIFDALDRVTRFLRDGKRRGDEQVEQPADAWQP